MPPHRSPLHVLVTLGLVAASSAVLADDRAKTDVVTIANGDTLHGEIIELAYGQLSLKTDSMGTVRIEWPDVRALASRYRFYVAHSSGVKYYGSLEPGDDAGTVVVRSVGGTASTLPMTDIATIDQVEDTFWSRINGSLSFGVNYTRSTDISVSSLRFDAEYRARRFVASVSLDGDRTTDPEGGTTERWDLSYNQQFLRPGRSFWFSSASTERNEQLGIDTRLQLAGGLGLNLRQTPSSALTLYGGLALNQEWTTDEEDGDQQTLEGVVGGDWRIFRFRDPETSLTSSLILYPGISDAGRYRSTVDISLRREMIEDLYLDLSVYGAYDNRAPSADEDTTSTDYGVVTSVGYSF